MPDSFNSAADASSSKTAAINVLLFFIFLVAAYFIVSTQKEDREKELTGLQSQLTELQNKKQQQEGQSDSLSKTVKQSDEMDSNLIAMREIADGRLLTVKVLEAVQSLLPQKTWLKSIKLKGDVLNLEGYSMVSTGMSTLFSSLEQSVYFSNVKILNQTQETSPDGNIHKFELTSLVGEQK